MHPSAQQAATHPKVYFRAGNDLNVVHFLIIVNNGRGRTEPAFPGNVECRTDESGIAASVKCPLKVNALGWNGRKHGQESLSNSGSSLQKKLPN